TDGWMLEELLRNTGEDFPVPFWWQKLFQDPKFNHRIKQRWYELRSSVYDVARIHAYIDAVADTLNEAQARNFAVWPGPGKPGEGFWPMPNIFYTFRTYRDETNYLKYWIERRIRWMDENVLKLSETLGRSDLVLPQDFTLLPAFPNPFNPSVNIVYELKRTANVFLGIYNTRGECIRVLRQGEQSGGRHQVQWDGLTEVGSPAASGVYYARMFVGQSREFSQSVKLLLLR
ncbi:MAG: CotH kinase family protein, partial [candidate division KSB1 bacterium]|nr:CotH kinase family protein [candidate division KSB1 bacterium]